MECPACGHDSQRVLVTTRSKKQDGREVLCKNCGRRFTQDIILRTVFDTDPETLKEIEVPGDDFQRLNERRRQQALKMRGRLDA
jgi:transcription elongation factor Elf1